MSERQAVEGALAGGWEVRAGQGRQAKGRERFLLLTVSCWRQHAGSEAGSRHLLRSTAAVRQWLRPVLTGPVHAPLLAVWLKYASCTPPPPPLPLLQGIRCVGALQAAADGAARPGCGAAAEGQGLQGGWRCLQAVGAWELASHTGDPRSPGRQLTNLSFVALFHAVISTLF